MRFNDNFSIPKLLLLVAILAIVVPVAVSENIEPKQKAVWNTGVDHATSQGVEGNADQSSDFTFSSHFTITAVFIAVCMYGYLILPVFRRLTSFHIPRAPPVAN